MCVRDPSTPGARDVRLGHPRLEAADLDRPVPDDPRPHRGAGAGGQRGGSDERRQQGGEEGPRAPSSGHRGTVATRRRRASSRGSVASTGAPPLGSAARRRGLTRSAERAEPTPGRARQAGTSNPSRPAERRERRAETRWTSPSDSRARAGRTSSRGGAVPATTGRSSASAAASRSSPERSSSLRGSRGIPALAGARGRSRGERRGVRDRGDRQPPHASRAHARGPARDRARPVGGARARPRLGRRSERARRPADWAPILYVCHSCFASSALARELLARGADPNATFANEYGDMSALYGAAGVVHDPELTRVLLEAGANPDDGESLYHSVEDRSTACLELLLTHGATVDGSNALAARARLRARSSTSGCCSTRVAIPTRAATSPTRFAAAAARRCCASWPSTAPT